VYQDGVRINEPFGDTVNWDLIPGSAISTINLIPGSNPLFGLNTLGGALSIRTKSGAQYPGTAATLLRRIVRPALSRGTARRRERRARLFCERECISRGRMARAVAFRRAPVFYQARLQDGTSDLDLSITHAESDLTRQRAAAAEHDSGRPETGLHSERPYSQPDDVVLPQRHPLAHRRSALVEHGVLPRESEKSTINGDLNEVSDPRNGVIAYDDGDPNASSVNRTRTSQRSYGFSTQAALTSGNLSGPRNLVIVGGGYDRSSSDFRQS